MNRSQIVRLIGACAVAGLVVACSEEKSDSGDTPSATGLAPDVCTRLWNDARADGDNVAQGKAGTYVTDFALVDADKNGNLTQTEWEAGCAAGTVKEPATN